MFADRQSFPETLALARQRASYLGRTFQLIWHAAPGHTTLWASLLLVQGLLPAALITLFGMLIDRLLYVVGADLTFAVVQPVMHVLIAVGGVLLLNELVQAAIDWVRGTQAEIVHDYISSNLHARATAIDLAFFETPRRYERLDRARSEASSRSMALLEHGGSMLQNSITVLALAGVLMRFGMWLPVLLLLSTLPTLYVTVLAHQRYYRWWDRTTADRRKANYYDLLLTFPQAAAELRVFGLGAHFQALYAGLRVRLRNDRDDLLRWQAVVRLVASSLALGAMAVVGLWLVWRAMRGLTTIGDLVIFYQAFSRGQTLMRSLTANTGQIFSNALFLESLYSFLEERSLVQAPEQPVPAPAKLDYGLRFRDVSFRYPGSAAVALDHCDLFIPAGSLVAIVGSNGAGKSTLVKLLCRLYDPEAGNVEIDGIDLRRFDPADLRRLITVLFQFPVRYHATAAENITLSDLTACGDPRRAAAAARSAGIHDLIERLPAGYNTMLGKWLAEGVELSGGEWQRLALARALLRDSSLIALDEPTSFMDANAETDWLSQLRTLVAGRTTLLITHRFTTAMRADLICVMDEGRIVEQGTHEQLLACGGIYAQSWRAQMQAAHHDGDTAPTAAARAPVMAA